MKTSGLVKIIPFMAAALLVSCTGNKVKQVETVEEKPKVKLETVKMETVDQTHEFTATVESNIKNNIAPSMIVRIDEILVEVGDHVKAGQTLVRMDASSLNQSKAQLDNYEMEFRRTDELYKAGGASKSEWDARKVSCDVARTSYENLVANTRLTSPINGVVTARNYDSGDMYSAGKPVLTIEQITPVKLMISISETFFTKVKKGMDVKVRLDVYGDEVFHGKVNLVYPTIDAQTRTFPVEIVIPNNDQKVRPGMFARVQMSFGVLDHVVVPDLAVVKQQGSGERFIYVYENGKVSYNKVELGRRLGSYYEVLSGVNSGDRVVVAGQTRLSNGAEVEVD